MDLKEIIGRLEKAERPDRELDLDICAAVGSYPSNWQEILTGYSLGYFIAWSDCAPTYTSSLDAALTLVPSDWIVEHIGQRYVGGWQCELHFRSDDAGVTNEAPTPALALCIAALHARLGKEG